MKYAIAAALFALALFTGCESAGNGSPSDESLTIGVVLLDSEYFDRGVAEIRSLSASAGHSVLVEQANDTSVQDSAVDSMIRDGVDVLVVTAHDTSSSTSRSWVTAANLAGVPFISYDRLISDVEGIDFFVGWDNEEVGRLQGQYIADNTQNGDVVLFFTGPDTDSNAAEFEAGARGVLDPLFTSGELVLYNDSYHAIEDWYNENANSLVDSFGLSVGDIDAILSPNDAVYFSNSESTEGGIYSALGDAGFNANDVADLVVVGHDAQLNAIRAISADPEYMDMTVLKDPAKFASTAIDAITALSKGQMPQGNTTVSNGSSNLAAHLEVPVAVDASNVQSEIVDTGWLTEEEISQ